MRNRELIRRFPSGTVVTTMNGELHGTVMYVDKNGMIRVKLTDGSVRIINAETLVRE